MAYNYLHAYFLVLTFTKIQANDDRQTVTYTHRNSETERQRGRSIKPPVTMGIEF